MFKKVCENKRNSSSSNKIWNLSYSDFSILLLWQQRVF